MKLNQFFMILICLTLVSACHYRNQKGSADVDGGNSAAGDGSGSIPGFATIQSQILAPRCYECHSNAGGNRGGINLESYQNVKNMARAVNASVVNNSMPMNRSPLTAAQKQLLASWVAAGSPENPIQGNPSQPGSPGSPDDTVSPSLDWLTVKTLVIDANCLGCHSSPNNRGGVNLETYRNAFDEIEDIEEAIREGSMPPRRQLTEHEKQLILNWIKVGAPEFQN